MSGHVVGSLVITGEEGAAAGIFTVHDVLNRVALVRADLTAPIATVMSPVRVSLPDTATAYDAALSMVREGVRHVVVLGTDGIVGVVSERDLFALQRTSLRLLSNEITAARDLEALCSLAGEVRRLARSLLLEGVSPEQLTQLISSLNELLTRRVLELEFSGGDLGGITVCWLALGSEGRLEQTLSTDQDNALIFEPPPGWSPEEARARLLPLAQRANTALAACGFPLCAGEVMAGNPRWCLSAEEWRREFAHWIESGDPQALLGAAIFFDFRPLFGEAALATGLRDWLSDRVAGNFRFLHQMAANALQNRPPLGFPRGFQVARTGAHRGTLDLKLNGTTIFVDAARIFSLAHRVTATSTAERLRGVAAALGTGPLELEAWVRSFYFLLALRLRSQEGDGAAGGGANRLAPADLDGLERSTLREVFRQAKELQRRLSADFLA